MPDVRALAHQIGERIVGPGFGDLYVSLVRQESGFQHTRPDGTITTSPAGALGAAQLMPRTAADLGVDPHDLQQNLEGGARYLRMLLDLFGDVRQALAAYNAGPGRVQGLIQQYGADWERHLPDETKTYLERVPHPRHDPAVDIPTRDDVAALSDFMQATGGGDPMVNQPVNGGTTMVAGWEIPMLISQILNMGIGNRLQASNLAGFIDPAMFGGEGGIIPTLAREMFQADREDAERQYALDVARFGLAQANHNFAQRVAQAETRLNELNLLASQRGPENAIAYNFLLNRMAVPPGQEVDPFTMSGTINQPENIRLPDFHDVSPGSATAPPPEPAPPAPAPAAPEPAPEAAGSRFIPTGHESGSLWDPATSETIIPGAPDFTIPEPERQELLDFRAQASPEQLQALRLAGFERGGLGSGAAVVGERGPELVVDLPGGFAVLNRQQLGMNPMDLRETDRAQSGALAGDVTLGSERNAFGERFRQTRDRIGQGPPPRGEQPPEGLLELIGTLVRNMVQQRDGAPRDAQQRSPAAPPGGLQTLPLLPGMPRGGDAMQTLPMRPGMPAGRDALVPLGLPGAQTGGFFGEFGNIHFSPEEIAQMPVLQKLTGAMDPREFGQTGLDMTIPGTDTALPQGHRTNIRTLAAMQPSEQALTRGVIETPRSMGGLGLDFSDWLTSAIRAAPRGQRFAPAAWG